MRISSYEADRAWSDRYIEQLSAIIRAQSGHIVSVQMATDDEDHRCVADMKIVITSGDILCRVRKTTYRDLTLRSWRASGVKTEAQKITEGAGRWYLYAWTDEKTPDRITDWMLLDLDKLRTAGLIEKAREIPNHDGTTGFCVIARDPDLRRAGVIIAEPGKENTSRQALDTLRTIVQMQLFQ